jgi:manganese transport protein
VILSMQLPFAIIPLIHFTSDKRLMGAFASPRWVRALAWVIAVVIVALNIWLVIETIGEWISEAGQWRGMLIALLTPVVGLIGGLLLWVALEPVLPRFLQRRGRAPAVELPRNVAANLGNPEYRLLLVPLDHSDRDRAAISHAAALARTYGASVILLHVEEGVTSRVYGSLSHTAEVEAGRHYIDEIAGALRDCGISVETVVYHDESPTAAIVRVARERHPDLVIMGAHGHSGLKDLVFGATINDVRHRLSTPILVVRDADKASG